MAKYAEAEMPAIYRKLRSEGVLVRSYTGGYPYSQNGLLMRSSIMSPIYSYGKNFKRFGKDFSLFIWTLESDQAKIESHLDKVATGLNRSEIMEVLNNIKSFSYVGPKYVAR